MKTFAFALLCVSVIASPSVGQGDGHGEVWIADYDEAVAAAKAAGKDLLVDFTGSDWCGWCKRLDGEVFSHDEFIEAATAKYVLVALDYPRGEEAMARVPNPARNEELSKKFGVGGFPTVMLVTTGGEAFGRTGYREGGPEAYVKHLEEVAADGRKDLAAAKKLADDWAAAKDAAAKSAVVEAALKALAGKTPRSIGFDHIAAVARHAFTLDPANETGLAERALRALLAAGVVDDEIGARVKTIDPANAKGLYEKWIGARANNVHSQEEIGPAAEMIAALFAMGPIKDAELDKNLSVNMAFWYHKFLGDADKAKTYARRAKALVGDDRRFERLFTMILGDDEGDAEEEEPEEGEKGEDGEDGEDGK